MLDHTKKTKEHGTVMFDNMEKEIRKINEAKKEYRWVGNQLKFVPEHEVFPKNSPELISNPSVQSNG